jgi:hypothetical protein
MAAYRRMTPEQRLARGLGLSGGCASLKSNRFVSILGDWSEEKVMNEVRRWVRDGMKTEELYEV